MSLPLNVLLVEDDDNDAHFICREIACHGFAPSIERVQTPEALESELTRRSFDLVISDYNIIRNHFTGMEVLRAVQKANPNLPVIIMSGILPEESVVDVMRAGAADLILKDKIVRLVPAIRRTLQESENRRARRLAEEHLQAEYAFRAAVEKTTPLGIVLFRKSGAIKYVNPGFCAQVGWSEANLLERKPPYIFWPKEERYIYLEEFWKALQTAAKPMEITFRHHHGHNVELLVQLTPLIDAGDPEVAWLGCFTDITELKRKDEALRQLNEQLERRVEQRTAELDKALGKLKNAVAERKKLEQELLDIVENERRRLGLELHDDLGQRLSGLLMLTKGLELSLMKRNKTGAVQAASVHANLQEAIHLTKGMAKTLVPWSFAAGELTTALKKLADETQQLFGVTCRFKNKGMTPSLTQEMEMHLYKIAQEAASNGIKHGKADKLNISLTCANKQLKLSIINNGLSFPAVDPFNAGSGLRIMNYRAHVIGANLHVGQGQSGGTEVRCELAL